MQKGDKFGDFTIQGIISNNSGFADIYEATGKDGSNVALKVLKPTTDPVMKYLFQNECQILKALKADTNAHIVDFKSHGNVGDRDFLAMEKLGAPLFDSIPVKPMALERATDFVIQVCEARVPVHARGHVHHDVQAKNLLFAGEGRIKVIDFGIAYTAGEPKTDQVLGLNKILSCEQLAKKRDDPRSDQYNVGLLYHYLLTSREFIRHLTDEPDLAKHGVDPPQLIVKVLQRMLAKKVDERYPSIEEPLALLQSALCH